MALHNVETRLDGDILTLKIDLSKRLGATPSGNERVGSSGGPIWLTDKIKMNLALYVPKAQRDVLFPGKDAKGEAPE